MQVTDQGLIAIARHEGVVPAPYLDPVNVWTFGIGHAETSGMPPNPSEMPRGMPADVGPVIAEAFRLFRHRIGVYEAGVIRAVTVPVAPHEFDALVSLCFNIGTGAFARSSVVRHLNNGNRDRAAQAFLAWNKAGGSVMPGLVARRADEKRLFETAAYPTGAIPVWGLTTDNRPDMRRPIRSLSHAEALAILRSGGGATIIATSPPRQPAAQAPEPVPAPTTSRQSTGLLTAILALLRRILGGKA